MSSFHYIYLGIQIFESPPSLLNMHMFDIMAAERRISVRNSRKPQTQYNKNRHLARRIDQ